MRKNNEYPQAIEQAQENLADLNERGADAIGNGALEFMDSSYTRGTYGKRSASIYYRGTD